ncbi:MAG: F0F1 ATP synthase subunit epsilon [Parabacteroides gordonii]|nr:F0F1 ATP synthase subunit epsilon [Parabacteroides gordonii]
MELEIISPAGILFKDETDYVSFPGIAGSFDVLPHHAPMIAALEEGVIRYQTKEKETQQEIKIQSGFVDIKDDTLSVCIEEKIRS